VNELVRTSQRWGNGDLGVRVGKISNVAEFSQLAQAFNQMAQSLEHRENEQKRTVETLHQLSGRLLRLQDEERRHIARELHDATAQNLAALAINLSILRSTKPELMAKVDQLLGDSLVLAEQCADEVRSMSYLLHPPLLEEAGLANAVRELVDGFAERSKIRVDLHISDNFGRLVPELELTLFRVLQESLSNVRRHSRSATASVNLEREAKVVWLEVRDQGCGMANSTDSNASGKQSANLGVGIAGMKERLNQMGGRLDIDSDSHGTSIKAILPLKD
jgi:signal transduction histidine kinase